MTAFYTFHIAHLELTPAEYTRFVTAPFVDERLVSDGITALIVRGSGDDIPPPGMLPVVVVGVHDGGDDPAPAAADLCLDEVELGDALLGVEHSPLAAVSLVVLLRHTLALDVEGGLVLESATYSTLQSGPEFERWRRTRTTSTSADSPDRVLVERRGAELEIVLNRPHRRNAIDSLMRDELTTALEIAVHDSTIEHVDIRANGPAFCSGGDLTEFGSRSDPASAHVIRLARSPARLVHRLRARTSVHIHGVAVGGGIEIAAFARHIVAGEGASFALPELRLGLIPGAGGTVSLPRRIGRQRTALLALTGRSIDARTALSWGLVDAIAPSPT